MVGPMNQVTQGTPVGCSPFARYTLECCLRHVAAQVPRLKGYLELKVF
jgi:hypothetical protein